MAFKWSKLLNNTFILIHTLRVVVVLFLYVMLRTHKLWCIWGVYLLSIIIFEHNMTWVLNLKQFYDIDNISILVGGLGTKFQFYFCNIVLFVRVLLDSYDLQLTSYCLKTHYFAWIFANKLWWRLLDVPPSRFYDSIQIIYTTM